MFYRIFNTKQEAEAYSQSEGQSRGLSGITSHWYSIIEHPTDGRAACVSDVQESTDWVQNLTIDWFDNGQEDNYNPVFDIKSKALQQLYRVFEQAEAHGMSISHSNQTYHLQCRPVDRTNWLGVKEIASALQPNDSFTDATQVQAAFDQTLQTILS